MSSLTSAQWQEMVRSQAATIESLQQRLAWFERQLFGSKSERLSVLENPQHDNGQGIAMDQAQAAVWIRKAADQGYPDAQHSLHIMLNRQ